MRALTDIYLIWFSTINMAFLPKFADSYTHDKSIAGDSNQAHFLLVILECWKNTKGSIHSYWMLELFRLVLWKTNLRSTSHAIGEMCTGIGTVSRHAEGSTTERAKNSTSLDHVQASTDAQHSKRPHGLWGTALDKRLLEYTTHNSYK